MVGVSSLLQLRSALFPINSCDHPDGFKQSPDGEFAFWADLDLEGGLPLSGVEPLVQHLECEHCTVDVEVIDASERREGDREVLAIPPGPISVVLPSQFEPGTVVHVRGGPHFREMEVRPPKWAKAGAKLHLQLEPSAELRIQVPDGMKSGEPLKINRADAQDIFVDTPAGLRPGEIFDYTPVALMVAAPEESSPGDFVVFRHHVVLADGHTHTETCRCQVPHELQFGRYFAARLPTCRDTKTPKPAGAWSLLPWGRAAISEKECRLEH